MRLIVLSLFLLVLFSFFVVAQESEVNSNSIIDEVLTENTVYILPDAGATPDQPLSYFFDRLFESRDTPEDLIANREERISEFEQMIREGKIRQAQKAIDLYKEDVSSLEESANPELRARSRESVATVYNKVNELKSTYAVADELVSQIILDEENLVSAVEFSYEKKNFCSEQAFENPSTFADLCLPDEGSPEWFKDLSSQLIEEQKKQSENFILVISSCFEDSSSCDCGSVSSVSSFYDSCNEIESLSRFCEIGGENTCELKDDSLVKVYDLFSGVSYLYDTLTNFENNFENNPNLLISSECRREGIATRELCKLHLYEKYKPEICLGISSPEECAKQVVNNVPSACSSLDFSNERAGHDCIEILRDQENKELVESFDSCDERESSVEQLICFEEFSKSFDQNEYLSSDSSSSVTTYEKFNENSDSAASSVSSSSGSGPSSSSSSSVAGSVSGSSSSSGSSSGSSSSGSSSSSSSSSSGSSSSGSSSSSSGSSSSDVDVSSDSDDSSSDDSDVSADDEEPDREEPILDEDSEITGKSIFTGYIISRGNDFLDYYYRF